MSCVLLRINCEANFRTLCVFLLHIGQQFRLFYSALGAGSQKSVLLAPMFFTARMPRNPLGLSPLETQRVGIGGGGEGLTTAASEILKFCARIPGILGRCICVTLAILRRFLVSPLDLLDAYQLSLSPPPPCSVSKGMRGQW